ncbi:ABC transporter permease [Cohnella thailandensis]|uniref:Transport permease protein n=1 Tax=Cohnella thailandensis TaxID=557557 RepID=A0A841SNS6_9BACL|nr:ABC transporter permease [Cohnella thailandensis]MBB6633594.1 ABC transporter permease [Cohnella thailandensis]MBP1974613.1 ABC-2 type transport system permease protein [Cohnella thailandensis]
MRNSLSGSVSVFTSQSVFIGRSMRHSLRNVDALIMAIVLPIMLMLMFTYIFGGAIDPTGDYVNYVVPGIILLTAGYGSASTAVDVNQDMTGGIIDRFRTMPIASHGVVIGHIVSSLARNLLATGIVILVAMLVGFRPSAGLMDWIFALAIIALFILALTWLFAGIGLVASSPAAASGYGFILLFLPYLSSAFVPTETMPSWLHGVANHQPITPIIETIRGLLTGTPIGNDAWIAVGWCLLILAVAFAWSVRSFRRLAGRR